MKIYPKINANLTANPLRSSSEAKKTAPKQKGEKLSSPKEASLPAPSGPSISAWSESRPRKRGSREATSLPAGSILEAGNTSPENTPRRWTVLAYYAGDNNLEEQMTKDLITLETVGSSEEMAILAQFDRGENASLQMGGTPGMTRYRVERFQLQPGELDGFSRYNPPRVPLAFSNQPPFYHRKITSPALKEFGAVDSTDPKLLQDFLKWGMKKYPAENYLICLYGHGTGVGGMINDDGPENENFNIPTPELKKVIKNAEKAAGVKKNQVLLALESCWMSQTENAYELKDVAERMLACPSSSVWDFPTALVQEGASGYNLEEMSRRLFAEGSAHPDLCTLSLLDLSKAGRLKKPTMEFIEAVKKSAADPQKLKSLMEVESRPDFLPGYPLGHYASDFINLTQKIAQDGEIKDPQLKKAAQKLNAALKNVVQGTALNPKRQIGNQPKGIGIMTAVDPQPLDEHDYQDLAFVKDTGWRDFMLSWGGDLKMEALGNNRLSCPRLKELAKTARRELRGMPAKKREHAKFKSALRRINSLPGLDREQKWDQSAYAVYRTSTFQALGKTAQTGKLNPQNPELASADKKVKELFTPLLLNEMCRAIASDPEGLEDILKIQLTVLSQLDGEISDSTLARAAAKLLGSRGVDKERKLLSGAELLLTLGNAAHCRKVIEVKNRSWTESSLKDAETFLKGLAALDK